MLRLKQHKQKVSIIYTEQEASSWKVLRKAVLLSLGIHCFLFFVFQIHVPILQTEVSPNMPVVFLDSDDGSFVVSNDSVYADFRQQLCEEWHLKDPVFLKQNAGISTGGMMKSFFNSGQKMALPSLSVLPWNWDDELAPSKYRSLVYPIKVVVHPELRFLDLIDDGAEVFHPSSKESLFFTPAFAEVLPQVEFQVDISLESGKIVKIIPQKELVNKRFQAFAELFLQKLRFSSSAKGKKIVSGAITLQFAGTFEKISPLVRWEAFR